MIGTVLGFWGAAELLRGGHGQVLLAVVALSAYAIVRSGPAIFQADAWQRSLSAGLRDYVPLQVRQTSSRIQNKAGDRPVLTLSPIYVIETGGSLLPSFVDRSVRFSHRLPGPGLGEGFPRSDRGGGSGRIPNVPSDDGGPRRG